MSNVLRSVVILFVLGCQATSNACGGFTLDQLVNDLGLIASGFELGKQNREGVREFFLEENFNGRLGLGHVTVGTVGNLFYSTRLSLRPAEACAFQRRRYQIIPDKFYGTKSEALFLSKTHFVWWVGSAQLEPDFVRNLAE